MRINKERREPRSCWGELSRGKPATVRNGLQRSRTAPPAPRRELHAREAGPSVVRCGRRCIETRRWEAARRPKRPPSASVDGKGVCKASHAAPSGTLTQLRRPTRARAAPRATGRRPAATASGRAGCERTASRAWRADRLLTDARGDMRRGRQGELRAASTAKRALPEATTHEGPGRASWACKLGAAHAHGTF